MTSQEFARISDDLQVSWGNAYTKAQLQRLWSMIRDISIGDLQKALEHLSMTANKAPNLAQIRAACLPAINRAMEERRRSTISKMYDNTDRCTLCDGTGWVTAYRANDPLADLAFICSSCQAAGVRGITVGHGARQWSDASTDETLFVRRLDDPSTREYLDAVKEWQASEGLSPVPNSDNTIAHYAQQILNRQKIIAAQRASR